MSIVIRPLLGAALAAALAAGATAQPSASPTSAIDVAVKAAEQQLHQSFTNLQFDEFGPAPVKGPLYQAIAGGKVLYYAPESEHILFAAVYDKNGVNQTALAQETSVRKKLGSIDPAKALAIGPSDAPTVIEFTDPDCPYCQALERFWASKAIEGKAVRRLVYFVSGIHPQAAAKAEHILCAPDRQAAFKALYAGEAPSVLLKCAEGHAKVEADAVLVQSMGISGTPTLIVDGRLVSGFQQAELEAFLAAPKKTAALPR